MNSFSPKPRATFHFSAISLSFGILVDKIDRIERKSKNIIKMNQTHKAEFVKFSPKHFHISCANKIPTRSNHTVSHFFIFWLIHGVHDFIKLLK